MPAMWKILRRIGRGLLFAGGLLLLPRLWTTLLALAAIRSAEDAAPQPVAIVFGAGLYRDGSPTPVLRDRLATAAELYALGKVEKLLFSGDNRTVYYNEPEAMRRYALQLGVPAETIVLDYAGLRTYDTCYRARHIFQVESAILVTQRFHLPRALYLCSRLGIRAEGVPADRQYYRKSARLFWQLRET
ncbi:MAG TPA: hypothetical protein ENJ02_04730, partial [Chloroflexi bacterium]|nr:hypothetical protein [Chloroflexota bacterium]